MSDETVPVMFRKEKDGNVLAVFPRERAACATFDKLTFDKHGHGGADWNYIMQKTRPAKPAEYAALKRAMEAKPYEYKLRVVARRTRR